MEGRRGEQKFTLGFVFDRTRKRVLLVHKQKPEWQKGKFNGVGGKYRPGESAEACIARETRQEARLSIPEAAWTYVGTVHQPEGDFGVLTAVYEGDPADAQKNDHEDIGWFAIDALPENMIGNLRWLIPLSLDRLQSDSRDFSVQY